MSAEYSEYAEEERMLIDLVENGPKLIAALRRR